MKSIKIKVIFVTMAFFMVFVASGTRDVRAARLNGKLINGPRNILYTVNGVATAYTSNISNAAYNWMYTGADNPIYMSPVNSNVGSTLDIYSYNESSHVIAYTSFYDKNDNQQSYNTDYWWNKIMININMITV